MTARHTHDTCVTYPRHPATSIQCKFSKLPQSDAETRLVRGGSATAVLDRFVQPGIYRLVNDKVTEALAAFAHVRVEERGRPSSHNPDTDACATAEPVAAALEAATATPTNRRIQPAWSRRPPAPGGPAQVAVTPAAAPDARSAHPSALAAPDRHVVHHHAHRPSRERSDPPPPKRWHRHPGDVPSVRPYRWGGQPQRGFRTALLFDRVLEFRRFLVE